MDALSLRFSIHYEREQRCAEKRVPIRNARAISRPAQSCSLLMFRTSRLPDRPPSQSLVRAPAGGYTVPAMRGRDGGDPPDAPWICRRLIYDPRAWQTAEEEAISRMKADELDQLLAAEELREIDRERISRMEAGELDRLVATGEISGDRSRAGEVHCAHHGSCSRAARRSLDRECGGKGPTAKSRTRIRAMTSRHPKTYLPKSDAYVAWPRSEASPW